MRSGATLSFLMHLAILLAILYGLPDLFKQQEVIEPVAVQLATVADLTAQPQPQAKPLPTPVVKPVTPPPPAPAAPQAPIPPPAPVPPQPAEQSPPPVPPQEAPQPPQPTVAEPPQPVIIPDNSKPPPPQPQQAQVESPPAPRLRPNVPPDQTKPKVKPAAQTADFNSLLKNIEKMNTQTANNADQTQQTPQPPQPQTDQLGQQLSSSELDALRSQIAGCWFLDPGKKGADAMVVEIHVDLGPDGTVVGNPQILDPVRAASDPAFQAAAEAARRALLKCSPLHMPAGKYDTWKSTTFRFNPSGMLG